MRRTVGRSTRLMAGPLAALVGFALTAPPCLAAGVAVPKAAPSLRAAVARLASSDSSAATRLTQGTEPAATAATSGEGRSFIHSGKGVAALLLLAGGITWAVISRSKDAVHSPGRK